MSAVRVARAATGRDRIVKFEGCYHGHADAFLVQGRVGRADARHADEPGRHARRRRPTRWSPRYNDLDSVERVFDAQPRSDRRASSSSRSPATWASCRRPTGSCAGCARSCSAHGALLIFDEVISGFRAARRRRAGARRRPPGSHLPRQDHRRRPAGRRVRRPRGSDGAGVAGRTGLSGRHAVGQPAGDDGGPLVPRSADAAALHVRSRRSARGSPPGSPTPRATPASRCRSTRSARC